MPLFRLTVNGKEYSADVDADTPLLWVLRDNLGFTGTKYGCGQGLCGSCTVLMNGEPVLSCSISVSEASEKSFTTIEGLGSDNPLVKLWIEEEASQCGYCQPGQVLTASSLLKKNPDPSDSEIENAMSGIICRCGTYTRIRKVIRRVAKEGGMR